MQTNSKPWIYRFGAGWAEGNGSMREELGGKGVSLAEMTLLGIAVPPGFTISTEACRYWLEHGAFPAGLDSDIEGSMGWLEHQQGRHFGALENPLLVSVRSGAAVSMPGMMDTILNVGIHDGNVRAIAAEHGNQDFALDLYRRLIDMYGVVVLNVPRAAIEAAAGGRDASGNPAGAAPRKAAIDAMLRAIERHTGRPFPADPRVQLRAAIEAVFRSWKNPRARHYRKMHGIPEASGTAVTVQAMVFGNRGETSATGVGFTRNPATGAKGIFGEFLANAQGEDIVAGIRTPLPISELEKTMPAAYRDVCATASLLEAHFRDVQDFEFTIEEGKLYLLQTRTAKRSAQAAIRTAAEMAEEGLITKEEALFRVKPNAAAEALAPRLALGGRQERPILQGLAASPASAAGQIALSAGRAVEMAGPHREHPVILVRRETEADDIHGMEAAAGFLTAHGGATSHAAVVARGMGRCCITGAGGMEIDEAEGTVRMGELTLREGDWLSLDGATGNVYAGKIPFEGDGAPAEDSALRAALHHILGWARASSRIAVRANADTPEDAARARRDGAAGIGLCRTEHMFFAPGRLEHVRAMILASTEGERREALDRLGPMQQSDFEAIFRAMSGLPVTIRLIDPPLHEFLPTEAALHSELGRVRQDGDREEEDKLRRLLSRVRELSESNPMLGLRGCRLGILYPEIVEMQVAAILRAALAVEREGGDPKPEIMIPLVACVEEIRSLREQMASIASRIFEEGGRRIPYRVGAMVELPRAALMAGEIARETNFLSFGTNDLTQMTFGFSRDDARQYLPSYLERGILREDPFQTIDREGVGSLIRIAIGEARKANPAIKIGVCGEHGGDPRSIEFFAQCGVDSISCSPARLAAAQLSAAQAAPRGEEDGAPGFQPQSIVVHATAAAAKAARIPVHS